MNEVHQVEAFTETTSANDEETRARVRANMLARLEANGLRQGDAAWAINYHSRAGVFVHVVTVVVID